jgi:ABC-type antimicrobial peptide transport system ATPase subunit
LKLYELRRNKQMRKARQWYFSEFSPTSAMDIVALFRGGERASANFRMVTSYWDTAASLVLNEGIDRKMFLDANTEHVFIYAKIADLLAEVRELFRDPDFLIHLETLVRSMPDFESKMESRRRLIAIWERGKKSEVSSQ